MSSINPSSVNLASSFAGAQRSDASADKEKAEAAQQNMAIDKKAMTDHQLHDVGDADKTGDRDADGRMPLGHEEEHGAQAESDEEQEPEEEHPKAPDVEGTLGTHLDLDA
ncbi:hypothetical protein [uncultured Gimesia sp.]|uniref:hypothetical protein n=1 Tax=uncultured Gimesia sp. TaxID=1678688 RepID=UPI0030D965B3|tara:strand:- start:63859 stop:64188 length:330 start_codon:yes stop_codon:yes gene_type:complete